MTNNNPIRLILSDIRSSQNVGAILRTSDAAGVGLVYACGYTPYPALSENDSRPAHVASANTKSIAKTALGAELTVPVLHFPDTASAVRHARSDGFEIIVIEQSDNSLNLYQYQPAGPSALILGNEVSGVAPDIIANADTILELPMIGAKESLNVSVAAGIALYQLRFGRPQARSGASAKSTR